VSKINLSTTAAGAEILSRIVELSEFAILL